MAHREWRLEGENVSGRLSTQSHIRQSCKASPSHRGQVQRRAPRTIQPAVKQHHPLKPGPSIHPTHSHPNNNIHSLTHSHTHSLITRARLAAAPLSYSRARSTIRTINGCLPSRSFAARQVGRHHVVVLGLGNTGAGEPGCCEGLIKYAVPAWREAVRFLCTRSAQGDKLAGKGGGDLLEDSEAG